MKKKIKTENTAPSANSFLKSEKRKTRRTERKMEQKKGESSIAPVPKVNERDVSVDLPLRGKKILPSYKRPLDIVL